LIPLQDFGLLLLLRGGGAAASGSGGSTLGGSHAVAVVVVGVRDDSGEVSFTLGRHKLQGNGHPGRSCGP